MDLGQLPPSVKLAILARLQPPVGSGEQADIDNVIGSIRPADYPLSSAAGALPPGLPEPISSSCLSPTQFATLANDGFVVIDDFLPAPMFRDCLPCLPSLPLRPAQLNASSASSSRWSLTSIRSDAILFLNAPPCPIPTPLESAIAQLRLLAADLTPAGTCELQLALYGGDASQRYLAHLDSSATQCPSRTFTAVLYFTDPALPDWDIERDGGALRAHLAGGEHCDIIPRPNRLVLFLSKWLLHEVRPVHRPRYALTAWIHH